MIRSMLVIAACLITLPAAARTLSYDCDTMTDRFSEITTPLAKTGYISGVVTPARIVTGERYATTTRVAIEGAGDKSWVGFTLTRAGSTDPDTLIAIMVISRAGQDEEITLGAIKLSQAVPFRLSLGKSGAAALELGDWKRTATIDLTLPATGSVSCSTGEFKFDSLDFGQ